MSHSQHPGIFLISDISVETAAGKVTDVYLSFSVRGLPEKEKTEVINPSNNTCRWERTLEIETRNPTKATVEVKGFSKRAILPDRLIGEYTFTLAHPGATANFSGSLAKKSGSGGTISFKIRPKGTKAARHGEVVTNRHSAYPGLETLQSLPTGARMKYEGEGVADQARDMTAATSQAASARANATAAQAQQRSNQVAGEAEGKTVATVNATEQKLQEFKQDMAEGRPPRRHHHDVQGTGQAASGSTPGMNTGQSAYSKTVGLPPEAGTADDESGAGAAHQVPYDAGLGGASGAVGGPIAPAGQGGLYAGSGTGSVGPSPSGGVGAQMRGTALNAANKAQSALETAKQKFSKS